MPSISRSPTVVSWIAAAFLLVLGWVGRANVTPYVLDKIFGISSYVLKEIAKKVDSGYPGTFIFDEHGSDKDKAEILFYAEKGQPVKITVQGDTQGDSIAIVIDGRPWKTHVLGQPIVLADVTNLLQSIADAGEGTGNNVHTIKFIPFQIPEGPIIVDCLVLVYNQ